MSTVPTDEIYDKYLQKAIAEINALGDEIAHASDGARVPVLGSGHPLADVMLLKYEPQPQEVQEGVALLRALGPGGAQVTPAPPRRPDGDLRDELPASSSARTPARRGRSSFGSCTSSGRSSSS